MIESSLRQIAVDLWVAEQPLRFMAMEVGTRATVIRLRSGALFVHSPIRLDANLQSELTRLGEVHFVVAPNRFHHRFVADYQVAFRAPNFTARRVWIPSGATSSSPPVSVMPPR